MVRNPHRQRIAFEHATETRFAGSETLVRCFQLCDLSTQARMRLHGTLQCFDLRLRLQSLLVSFDLSAFESLRRLGLRTQRSFEFLGGLRLRALCTLQRFGL